LLGINSRNIHIHSDIDKKPSHHRAGALFGGHGKDAGVDPRP